MIEVAIVRPGPIQGDMVHPFLKRRSGKEPVTFPCPDPAHGAPDELERILGRTLGVPIFQEQAMKIALDAAQVQLRGSQPAAQGDGDLPLAREYRASLQDKMVGRMVARGYDRDFAQRCFDQIKGFGEYGFPESHAASFAHLVYVSSWIKWKYPAAFACALLNSQPMGFYAPAQIVRDAREHGVEVREVDVNHSDWDCTLEAWRDAAWALRQVDGLAARRRPNGWSPRRPYRTVEELRIARPRAGACDPAARRGRRVPVDGPRPARGVVGFARAQAGARPAVVRLCRSPRRRRGTRARAASRRCPWPSMW